MKHLLAYGNSDQASFRDPLVRSSFDFMTVPGTIAAYYPDATAAFVLSSELDYLIDPRTPLFQGDIREPRPSHYSLATVISPTLAGYIADSPAVVRFPADLYSNQIIDELVSQTVSFQRSYGGRAAGIQAKLERYQSLLGEARGELPIANTIDNGKPPRFILAPYFLSGTNDTWADVMEQIWERCVADPAAADICPVVATISVDLLSDRLQQIPEGLSDTVFFWVNAFDERRARIEELQRLWDSVSAVAEGRQLVNLYGGFFSICLHYVGLWAFNNGLGYSESRDWPELPTTGAAPARYYIPRIHAFASQTSAQLLVDLAPSFACPCEVCSGRQIVELSYHDLKRHFALTRRSEIALVHEDEPSAVARSLIAALNDYAEATEDLPRGGLGLPVSHLQRWASVLGHPR